MPQYVGSKWRKTAALLHSTQFNKIIPKTVRFNRLQLKSMLQKFSMVYVKPDMGSHGKGVMKVEHSNGQYRFQLGEHPRTFRTYEALYDAIRKETKGRSYLVQRGVHLLTHKGRRFDLRVMVQWSPRRVWETTGIIGRVSAPRKIITNYHGGGKLTPVRKLLGGYLAKQAVEKKIASLERMGVRAGQAMRRKFPRVCEIGVDVGMDRTMTPWVLEVNTAPDPYIFRKLSDPSIFKKIRRYAKAYGRLK
ncbi:YheC/YheD family protein [Cohnella abietis]|uniref:YheC/YheD family protein n=1 Tax=Cohnella abietis TaxID=2507935 RepID=A0A3T1D2T1_9BACL|nr:YheC/YheD family protein [Cohnella abietis]BBI32417.1 hypothetical protein KCTCHS21_18160 [Cohnella abietis]